MRLEPMNDPRPGQRVACAACGKMIDGKEALADLDAPAFTFYHAACVPKVYACPNCYCLDIVGSAWINLNTGEQSGSDGPVDRCYCPACSLIGGDGDVSDYEYLDATTPGLWAWDAKDHERTDEEREALYAAGQQAARAAEEAS